MLGLHFCARAFSSCSEWGPLFITVRGPLTVAASPVAEHRLQMRSLSSCGLRAQLLRGMWALPRPGLEPVSPALAGRFSTTAPPGKPSIYLFKRLLLCVMPSLLNLPIQLSTRAGSILYQDHPPLESPCSCPSQAWVFSRSAAQLSFPSFSLVLES